jgi:tryptophanyl-tRNA synthetase
VIAEFAGQPFSSFKNALAEMTIVQLTPMASEMRRLLADPAEIDRILKAGAQKARAIATPVMDEVKKRVGFIS